MEWVGVCLQLQPFRYSIPVLAWPSDGLLHEILPNIGMGGDRSRFLGYVCMLGGKGVARCLETNHLVSSGAFFEVEGDGLARMIVLFEAFICKRGFNKQELGQC